MARRKHVKLAEAKDLPIIFDHSDALAKSKVAELLAVERPVVLELACGQGEYSCGLAPADPRSLYIGVDIQGERLWAGAKKALEKSLSNVYFLRADISQLETFFPSQSVSEVWIVFPDPYPRLKQSKKRLTSKHFLSIYRKILRPQGLLKLKTDNEDLFDYSVESLEKQGWKITKNIKNIDAFSLEKGLEIQTYFEQKARKIGKKIHYLEAK